MTDVGDQFQQHTKYDRASMPRHRLDPATKPKTYKQYPGAKIAKLPAPKDPNGLSLHQALAARKSTRTFADTPISKQSLSYLLWASTGISRKEQGYEFRTAPSAGALYPIETYLCINNVEDIRPGIYHYNIRNHNLERLAKGDFAVQTARAALDQSMCVQAAVVFIWTAVFERSKWKYDQRTYRYVYLDAGHIAENLALAAASLNLAACHIAAIYDQEANAVTDIDGQSESTIYMTATGHPG